jgi:outer membrane receptor protein involved in Fe transport
VEFSPSVGALFWITEEFGIFGNYAESVISPTGFAYDVFGEITPPETGSGIEIGLKYSSKDGKINAQLTGFQIDKKNEQRNNVTWPQLKAMFPRVSSGNLNDPNNTNVIEANSGIWRENFDSEGNVSSYSFDPVGNRVADEEARSKGMELDLYYNPNKNISIFMGYAYLDTTVLTSSLEPLEDLTVPGTANHSANAQIRYTFFDGPLKGWFIGGNQKYRSAALLNTYFADLNYDGEEDFLGLDADENGVYEVPAQKFALRLQDNLQTDFFVGWGGKLGKGRNDPRARFQLTLLNAFNAIDLISTGANNARFTESRSIRLSASLTF